MQLYYTEHNIVMQKGSLNKYNIINKKSDKIFKQSEEDYES